MIDLESKYENILTIDTDLIIDNSSRLYCNFELYIMYEHIVQWDYVRD